MRQLARFTLVPLLLAVAATAASRNDAGTPSAWPGWGGPDRDFNAPASAIASSWPESGPEELWSRDLGEGYSAIVFEDDRLYTMYRDGGKEIVRVRAELAKGEDLAGATVGSRIRLEGQLTAYGADPLFTLEHGRVLDVLD